MFLLYVMFIFLFVSEFVFVFFSVFIHVFASVFVSVFIYVFIFVGANQPVVLPRTGPTYDLHRRRPQDRWISKKRLLPKSDKNIMTFFGIPTPGFKIYTNCTIVI